MATVAANISGDWQIFWNILHNSNTIAVCRQTADVITQAISYK